MKRIMYVALLIVMTFSISMPVMAKTDKCGKSGCYRDNDTNGTIYCNTHAAQYVREQGYKACLSSSCYKRRLKNSSYCSSHTCRTTGCYSKVTSSNGKYCTSHDPSNKKKTTTTTMKYTSTSKKTTSSSTSKNKSTWESYDDGYNDVYDDDDYDWDRYWSDSDYADGVDDAMDELDW